MAETSNIKLHKPADGSQKWGDALNSNFDTIDSQFTNLESLIKAGVSSSGLTAGVNPSDFKIDGNKIIVPNIQYYFYSTSGGTGGTFYSSSTDSISSEGETYKNYYFGLFKAESLVTLKITSSLQEIKTVWLTNNDYILLGSVAVSGDTLAKDTLVINPWFANYSISDRKTSFYSMGTISGLNLKPDGDGIKLNTSAYYWEKEGINPNSSNQSYHIKENFLTLALTTGRVQFFRAIPNTIFDEDELTLQTVVDYKYYDNSLQSPALKNVADGSYSIQRIGVIGNSNAVVFYGTQQYNNLIDLQNDLIDQSDLNTSIRVKEVARMIVSNNSIVGIYGLDELNDAVHLYSIGIDSQKKQYISADAAEIRSDGIVPELGKITTGGISGLTVCRINRDNFNNQTIAYTKINSLTFTPSNSNEWRYINLNSDNTISYDTGLAADKINLGYLYKNSNYSNIQVMPEYCTTSEINKERFRYNGMEVTGFAAVSDESGKIVLQGTDNIIFKQGIKYLDTNGSFANHREITSTEVKFRYRDSLNTNTLSSTIIRPTSGYEIQKLLVLADGSYIMIEGEQTYNEKPTNIFGSDEGYTFHPYFACEIARFIVPANGEIESYYTNKTLNGNVQINYVKVAIEEGSTLNLGSDSKIGSVGFAGSGVVTTNNNINLDTIASSVTTNTNNIAAIQSQINITKGNSNTGIYLEDGTFKQCAHSVLTSVPANVNFDNLTRTATTTQDGLMSSTDKSLLDQYIMTGASAPGTTRKAVNNWLYIDTSNHKVYVWDGDNSTGKYQLMNSWQ